MRRTKLANVCFASGVANHESPVTTSRGRKTNTIHEITLNYTKWRRLVRVASCDFVDRLLVLFTTFAATCQYSSLITHHSSLITHYYSYPRKPLNFVWVPAYPGNTACRFEAPRCLFAISPNTSRKSVVSARSRPSLS